MSSKATLGVVLLAAAVLVGLPLVHAQKDGDSRIPETDVTGVYNLVSVGGRPVQGGAGSITVRNGGTFVSTMTCPGDSGNAAPRDFKGVYVRQGDDFILTWWSAGQTGVTIKGTTLTMNNEGTLFVYERSPKESQDLIQPKIQRIEGALEGEKMTVLGKTGGFTQEQPMGWFGAQWSGSSQLWWTGAKPGDKLDLGLGVKREGAYKLTAQFTKACDYGIAQLYLDGEKLGSPIDLYNDGVIVSGIVALGNHNLDTRLHKLTVEIVSANPRALPAYMVGIDYLKLEPVGK